MFAESPAAAPEGAAVHPAAAHRNHRRGIKAWLTRLGCWLAIAVCLVLGIVGIILPIVPGLLFLLLCAVLLNRMSPSARRLSARLTRSGEPLGDSWLRQARQRWNGCDYLSTTDKARLAGLYLLRGITTALDRGYRFLARRLPG